MSNDWEPPKPEFITNSDGSQSFVWWEGIVRHEAGPIRHLGDLWELKQCLRRAVERGNKQLDGLSITPQPKDTNHD